MEAAILYLIFRSLINVGMPVKPLIELEEQKLGPYLFYVLLLTLVPSIILYVYYMKDYYKEKYVTKVFTVSKTLFVFTYLLEVIVIYLFYQYIDNMMWLAIHGVATLFTAWTVFEDFIKYRTRVDGMDADYKTGIIRDSFEPHMGLYARQEVKLVRDILGGYVVENEHGQEVIISRWALSEVVAYTKREAE
ncbi:hypothetical protein ENBRE01_1932 [Enteropsectra breve]|nr:hypothetical protein ENBRE01_1932 [Enteropsectra breve]